MFRIISASILFTLALGDTPSPIPTCDSSVGKVEKTIISGCNFVNGRYVLKRGTDAGIEIKFDTDKRMTNVIAVVHGIISGIKIPFPLPDPDGCKVLKCPLEEGGPYSYKAVLPVSRMYPKIVVDIEWALHNEDDEVIACVRIPAKVE